ncbi:transcriptional regulator MraZ [Spirochaetia bacterium]|nr:transcriptional regulator MraZ [Spirochaetia bacterium]
MELGTGYFNSTLDDKGRLSLPVRLRTALTGVTPVLTQGADGCLRLYHPEDWKIVLKTIMDNTSPFDSSSLIIRRRLIGPTYEMEIDKAGRIAIPSHLREFAALARDCVVLGQFDYLEIWADERYRAYLEAHENDFKTGSEELGALLKKNRDSGG